MRKKYLYGFRCIFCNKDFDEDYSKRYTGLHKEKVETKRGTIIYFHRECYLKNKRGKNG